MKKAIAWFAVLCLLLAGCAKAEIESGKTICPLPDTTMENLEDAILAVSLEKGDAYVDDTGKSPRGLAQTRPMCYSVNKDTPLKRKEPTPWH